MYITGMYPEAIYWRDSFFEYLALVAAALFFVAPVVLLYPTPVNAVETVVFDSDAADIFEIVGEDLVYFYGDENFTFDCGDVSGPFNTIRFWVKQAFTESLEGSLAGYFYNGTTYAFSFPQEDMAYSDSLVPLDFSLGEDVTCVGSANIYFTESQLDATPISVGGMNSFEYGDMYPNGTLEGSSVSTSPSESDLYVKFLMITEEATTSTVVSSTSTIQAIYEVGLMISLFLAFVIFCGMFYFTYSIARPFFPNL